MKFCYKGIRSKQTKSENRLVQFAAPAHEIRIWAGVPQKKLFETGEETAGFQREENPARIQNLADFYRNPENIIPNPLLCALRELPICSVDFKPSPEHESESVIDGGDLIIKVPDLEAFALTEVLRHVREYIEKRVPDLKSRDVDTAVLSRLREQAQNSGYVETVESSEEDVEDEDEASAVEMQEDGDAAGVLFEESHIIDFWNDVAARHELLKQLGAPDRSEFLGFTKEALLSYLRPIVLVDGQHRLAGALAAAEEVLNEQSVRTEIEERITGGDTAEVVEKEILERESRLLPVSLLMSSDPAEQVFQFIIVNQKATPIGRALLGTIVSTTLSNDEMDGIATRLGRSGIEIEESQAVTFLTRHPNSPFRGLVERGLAGDNKHLLQWGVFLSLVRIFRNLKGGKIFGLTNDYASLWRQYLLSGSEVVAEFEVNGFDSPLEYWSSKDGPWRDVFVQFWKTVRDKLGSTEDSDRYNYWGNPRSSNLFNKVSLTILAADFFQFLSDTRTHLKSVEEIPHLVNTWLEYVNAGYFDKNWDLTGVKKDSTGIRNQWANIWVEYRKSGGRLPDRRLYRRPRGQ